MIIIDEEDASLSKPTSAAITVRDDSELPPPYTPHSETRPLLPSPTATGSPPKKLARRRFLRAFAAVAVFSILIGALLHNFFHFPANKSQKKVPADTADPPFGFPNERWIKCLALEDQLFNEAADDVVNKTTNQLASIRSAYAELDFPELTDAIFLLSKGFTSDGSLDIVASAQVDRVTVRVDISYRIRDTLEAIAFCLLEREKGNYGVGILINDAKDAVNVDEIKFVVQVPLPQTVIHYKALQTNLPHIQHRFNLGDLLIFDNVSVNSSNASMAINSLYADRVDISTTNAPITGAVQAISSISLETTVSPTDIDILVHNDDEDPSRIVIKTDSTINARVRLSSSGLGGSYEVNASTSGDVLQLQILDAPLSPALRIDAEAPRGVAVVTLPSTYEGKYDIISRNSAVVSVAGVSDPSGLGRRRRSTEKHGRGANYGSVWWGDEPSHPFMLANVVIRASEMAYLFFS